MTPFLSKLLDAWPGRRKSFIKWASRSLLVISLFNVLLVLYDLGFRHSASTKDLLNSCSNISLILLFLLLLFKFIAEIRLRDIQVVKTVTEFFLLLLLFLVIDARFLLNLTVGTENSFVIVLGSNAIAYILFILVFVIEFSRSNLEIHYFRMNPALIFILSFILLILFGTALLLLPNATTIQGISFIDALFTSTSAVCVTGLIVLDTSTDFTWLGQFFILLLIQLGGLGIMTFTSFFGFFFKGNQKYQNQIFLKDIVNEENLSEIFRTLIKIVIFTFSFELIGFFLIYLTLDEHTFGNTFERIWFAVFHSISAFCNAGFSTLRNGLYEIGFRNNYSMQLVIANLIVIGGLGFPIIFNLTKYLKSRVLRLNRKYILNAPPTFRTQIINVNTKLVLITTASLLIFGMLFFVISEFDNNLSGKSFYGKVVTTYFASVTPRTAGFNTIDMTSLAMPTILIYLFLMWIGASPGSVGGGVKTSTFAVSVLNAFSLARGKNRIEIFGREIYNESVRRAFAIILLSFVVIGMAIFFVTLFDPQFGLIEIIFECFSAYSTVGLSLGITGSLSAPSKVVIIFTMLIGRVGTLTILIALIRKIRTLNYRYPRENVFIN